MNTVIKPELSRCHFINSYPYILVKTLIKLLASDFIEIKTISHLFRIRFDMPKDFHY